MADFTVISQHLSSKFNLLQSFLQIEKRWEFRVIDFKGDSYIFKDFSTENNLFTILCDGETLIIDADDADKNFRITNNVKSGFIPIDGRTGLLGYGESHCDFIFFNENDFCFVEFKLNATSLEVRAIRKNRRKAVEQLGNTIDFFDKQLNSDYLGVNIEAYVCTPETYPRNDTAWESLSVEFLENFRIPLFERSYKEY